MKKVSIVTTLYNEEENLNLFYDKFKQQTFKNYEVIFINDGSTDNSEDILKKICQYDDRFTYINQKNSGVSAARNNGMKAAKGEYIAFLDADDYWDSTFLEKMVTNIEKKMLIFATVDTI